MVDEALVDLRDVGQPPVDEQHHGPIGVVAGPTRPGRARARRLEDRHRERRPQRVVDVGAGGGARPVRPRFDRPGSARHGAARCTTQRSRPAATRPTTGVATASPSLEPPRIRPSAPPTILPRRDHAATGMRVSHLPVLERMQDLHCEQRRPGTTGVISIPRPTTPWARRPGCPHRSSIGVQHEEGFGHMIRLQAPLAERYTDPPDDELADRISAAKAALGDRVFILGHHYQRDEVIRWADVRGDSFKLAQAGGRTPRGRLHRLLRRALHGRGGRHPHRRPPAGRAARSERRLLDGRHGRHRQRRGGVGGAGRGHRHRPDHARSPT